MISILYENWRLENFIITVSAKILDCELQITNYKLQIPNLPTVGLKN